MTVLDDTDQHISTADVEIMVDLGILVPRKFLSSQKIFREITHENEILAKITAILLQ